MRNRNAYQFINLGHYFSFEYNRLWTVAEMNLQTEEIEFENQLVDTSPMKIHWNIDQQVLLLMIHRENARSWIVGVLSKSGLWLKVSGQAIRRGPQCSERQKMKPSTFVTVTM